MAYHYRKSSGMRTLGGWLAAAAVMVGLSAAAWGGNFGGGGRGAVGGISIDAQGVVSNVQPDARRLNRQEVLKVVENAPAALNAPVEMRMLSVKGLEAALAAAQRDNLPSLPDELQFLAGLQRIQYVVVVPEENDILLIGPGEGWKVDEGGTVVGITTGRPVLLLEDLLVVLRSTNRARQEGISCSIDPTPEGRQNLDRYLQTVRTFNPSILDGMTKALGQQQITLTGVPADSHVARVLVAADYHMKRIAMNLERSPVASLPGFLDLLQKKKAKPDNLMPRWWLACNYEPLLKSADGLTFELRGPGVKALTEDDVIAKDGTATSSGRKNPIAQQWADQMTQCYDELSGANPVFGELRNIMDLCVIAALIDKEDLLGKAGCSVPTLTDANGTFATHKWPVPKTLATQCSFLKIGREYVVTASGGVQVDSYSVASKVKTSPDLNRVREKALNRDGKAWWWNG